MFVKMGMVMYIVLEIIEHRTPYDCRLEYLCSNGKYNIIFDQEQFCKGETFI